MRRILAIGSLAIVASLLIAPPAAQATFPGVNGKIAFQRHVGTNNDDVFTMNPDGTNPINITNSAGFDQQPAWSPDGTKIAFVSDRGGNFDIWTMNADGSNPVNRSSNGGSDQRPQWSPDGSKIAFDTNRDGNSDIYVMNADGTNQVNLTSSPAYDYGPTWSPDGTQIAFQSGSDISKIDVNGSNLVNLTNDGTSYFDYAPNWAPDGTRIVFYRQSSGGGFSHIWTMNVDGTNTTQITITAASDYLPAWSPDGTQITFGRGSDIYTMNADGTNQVNRTGTAGLDESSPAWESQRSNGRIVFASNRSGNYDVWTMKPDGSDLKRLTTNAASDSDPVWSRDGTKIAFVSNRSGNYDVWTMNADGSNQQNRTNNSVYDADPTWSPDGSQIAFTSFRPDQHIWKMNADGSGQTQITSGSWADGFPSWSPNGDFIAFNSTRDTNWNIYVTNPAGTLLARVTESSGDDIEPVWSPDGSQIAFASNRDGNYEIFTTVSRGASPGVGETRRTSNGSVDDFPAWSPDGKKIALDSGRDGNDEIYTMDIGGFGLGTNQINRTSNSGADTTPDWAPLITTGYARPRGATPINFRLVPAFNACTTGNGRHGAPFSVPSCSPPTQSSGFLTFNAPDRPAPYNTAANGTGLVTMKVFCTNAEAPPCTAQAGDQQDVRITTAITDVRCLAGRTGGGCPTAGGNYNGKLLFWDDMRITDRFNGPSLTEPATLGGSYPLYFGAQCAAGLCNLTTTADAVIPSLVREQKRAIWQLGQMLVYDGGPDGDLQPRDLPVPGNCPPACVPNDGETLFLQQGFFAP
jgi:Tol biopolymer transport system component